MKVDQHDLSTSIDVDGTREHEQHYVYTRGGCSAYARPIEQRSYGLWAWIHHVSTNPKALGWSTWWY